MGEDDGQGVGGEVGLNKGCERGLSRGGVRGDGAVAEREEERGHQVGGSGRRNDVSRD